MSRKIAFIGASYLFVPTTMRDILLNGHLDDSEIYLFDIDPEPLKVVFEICSRMIKQRNANIKIFVSKTRKAALEKADYVVVSVLVGGLDVVKKENQLCKKHKIVHTVGDTIGPMCTARILRQIPLLVDIARDMEKLCPGAPMLSPTNPMSAITTAVNRYTNVHCIGICHGSHFIRDEIAKAYKVDPLAIEMNLVGVNHLAFVDRVSIAGKEMDINKVNAKVSGKSRIRYRDPAGHDDSGKFAIEFGQRIGYMPNNGDHHFIEFFPWFLNSASLQGPHKNKKDIEDKILNIPKRMKRKRDLKKLFTNWAHKLDEVPDMDKYGDDHIQDIILGLENKKKFMSLSNIHLNVVNGNSVSNLPKNAVLELTATLSKKGAKPIKNAELDMFRWGVISRLVAITELSVKAAVENDQRAFMQALHLDPLVQSFQSIPDLADGLWKLNRPFVKPRRS